MKLYRSSITDARPFPIEEAVSFPEERFSGTYPLLGIRDALISGEFQKFDDIVVFSGTISGKLVLADARTNEPFEMDVTVDGPIDLLEEEAEGDVTGYLFPDNGIDTDDVVFSVLRSETPIKPLSGHSSLPRGGDGWSFCAEGEEENQASPFDVLENLFN